VDRRIDSRARTLSLARASVVGRRPSMRRRSTRRGRGSDAGVDDHDAVSVSVSIIVPTYEERVNIGTLYELIRESERAFNDERGRWEIIVVDDNSPDGTADVVREIQRAYDDGDGLVLMERPGKLGLGSAYVHGLTRARGAEVVIMDADLSHHPKYIGDFLRMRRANDLDVVSGTRYAKGGGVAGWDFRRKLTSRAANYIAKVALAPGASDLTGSFRLYKRDVLKALVSAVQSKGYVFQMEIIVRAKKAGYTVGEVPITFVDRLYGESKLGASEIVGYLRGLIKLFFTL